jgi:hypothetical protein
VQREEIWLLRGAPQKWYGEEGVKEEARIVSGK